MYVIQEVDEDAISDRSSIRKDRLSLNIKKEQSQIHESRLESLKEEEFEEEQKQGEAT